MTGFMMPWPASHNSPAEPLRLSSAPEHAPVIPNLSSSAGARPERRSADVWHGVSRRSQPHLISDNSVGTEGSERSSGQHRATRTNKKQRDPAKTGLTSLLRVKMLKFS